MARKDPLIRRNFQLRRAAYARLRRQARKLGVSVALLVRVVVAEWLRATARDRRDWDRGIPKAGDLARQLKRR